MSQFSAAEQQANAPQELRNVASFLRSGKAGMKVRVGALNGKRVDYFKGEQPSALPPTHIISFSVLRTHVTLTF